MADIRLPSWSSWKTACVAVTNPLPIQYVDSGDAYYIWVTKSGTDVTIVIPKLGPDGNVNPDATDFETNNKAAANQATGQFMLAGDVQFPAESYQTTNALANARPVNGDMSVGRLKTKKIYIENLGSNAAVVSVYGNLSNVSGLENLISVLVGQALTAGQGVSIEDDTPYQTMQVQAKSTILGLATTVRTRGYALGT